MARPTGTWLTGLRSAGVDTGRGDRPRGARLGLPPDGPGSPARQGRKLAALLIDGAASAAVAGLVTAPQPPELWSYAPLALLYVVLVPLTGQTLGMRLLGLRLTSVAGGPLDPLRAVLRLALLALLLPAVITDADGRGLHDRAARSVVVRT